MGKKIALLVVVGFLVAAAFAYRTYRNIHSFTTERVSEDVSVVFGFGGNVGVLRTKLGPVVVDTLTFRSQAAALRELVEDFGGGPTAMVVNTHYHRDHTHGNPAFEPGTTIVATAQTLEHLLARDGEYWAGPTASVLPDRTFEDSYVTEVGGKHISFHHLGRGHTDGDLVVVFEEDRVLHSGDLFFHGSFPNIDLEAGGSIREWIGTIDRVLELEFDQIIPGHGPTATREDLLEFQTFLRELWAIGRKAAANGATLEATLRNAELPSAEGLEDVHIPFILRLDRDFVIRRAWEEATGAVVYEQS